MHEQRYLDANPTAVNELRAYLSEEQRVEQQKAYYKSNKETILVRQNAYNETNKEAILARNKAYYEANREALSEYYKARYEVKKEILSAKTTCACGGNYILQNKAKHSKTNKHKNYLATIKE
jgi:hypothetical protein